MYLTMKPSIVIKSRQKFEKIIGGLDVLLLSTRVGINFWDYAMLKGIKQKNCKSSLRCKMDHLAYCDVKAKELARIVQGEKSMLI